MIRELLARRARRREVLAAAADRYAAERTAYTAAGGPDGDQLATLAQERATERAGRHRAFITERGTDG